MCVALLIARNKPVPVHLDVANQSVVDVRWESNMIGKCATLQNQRLESFQSFERQLCVELGQLELTNVVDTRRIFTVHSGHRRCGIYWESYGVRVTSGWISSDCCGQSVKLFSW
jgi:hypothetical protein